MAQAPIHEHIPRFAELLAIEADAETDMSAHLRAAGSMARPLGDDGFPSRIKLAEEQIFGSLKEHQAPVSTLR